MQRSGDPPNVYDERHIDNWAGPAPFFHASGIWGRGRMISFLSEQVQKGDTVLDLGCGAGLPTSYLCPMVGQSGTVRGYDSSLPLIAEAKKLELAFAGLSFHLVDISQPLPDNSYSIDLITSFMLIQNLSEYQLNDMLQECRRCLAPGGKIAFLTLHPNFFESDWTLPFMGYDRDAICAWRSNPELDARIDGTVIDIVGVSKSVYAFPRTRDSLLRSLSSAGFNLFSDVEICIDQRTIEAAFGYQPSLNIPNGPLFWIFAAR